VRTASSSATGDEFRAFEEAQAQHKIYSEFFLRPSRPQLTAIAASR
jgi:hypothetical protein